jgi:hypothetical protein
MPDSIFRLGKLLKTTLLQRMYSLWPDHFPTVELSQDDSNWGVI